MKKINLRSVVGLGVLSAMVSVAGCASSDKTPDDHHDVVVIDQSKTGKVTTEFQGHCAMAMAKGMLDKMGTDSIRLEAHGKTYVFSSEEQKAAFQAKLEKNIRRAERGWRLLQAREVH